MPRKPTLAEVMVRHHIYTGELAHASKVSSLLVNDMYNGRPVAREDAEKILAGLNTLTESSYTLEELKITLSANKEGA